MSLVARIGPSLIGLAGRDRCFEAAARELEAAPSMPASGVLDAELHIAHALPSEAFAPEIYSAKGNFNFNRERFHRQLPIPHRVSSWTGDAPCRAAFAVPEPKKRQRLLDVEVPSPLMTYSGFWGLMHFVLGRRNAGFVHAAIATRGQGATCFVGTGGCGKTSTLFTLLEEPEQRYVSEDFGIVDASGHTYYSPKHVSIYASDTRSPILRRHVETQLTFRQRQLWMLRSARGNPRVKGSPRTLTGGRVAERDEIARVFYLVRTVATAIEVKSLGVDELAERAACVAQRELASWAESLLMIAANDLTGSAFPTVQTMASELRQLYRSAFARSERRLVVVPHACPATDLIAELRRQKLL